MLRRSRCRCRRCSSRLRQSSRFPRLQSHRARSALPPASRRGNCRPRTLAWCPCTWMPARRRSCTCVESWRTCTPARLRCTRKPPCRKRACHHDNPLAAPKLRLPNRAAVYCCLGSRPRPLRTRTGRWQPSIEACSRCTRLATPRPRCCCTPGACCRHSAFPLARTRRSRRTRTLASCLGTQPDRPTFPMRHTFAASLRCRTERCRFDKCRTHRCPPRTLVWLRSRRPGQPTRCPWRCIVVACRRCSA